MKIVLVDDEWAFLEIVSYLLRKKGYELLPFGDSKECLEWLSDSKNECPTLIITDLMMPYHTGTELLQIIRSGNRCQKTPAILISSMENIHFDKQLFSRFVPKSNILAELPSAVEQSISRNC
jgi:CheY-like chemotaxis protein